MLEAKLLIFLFLSAIADALFHRLPPTIKPWEPGNLSHPKITTDPAQTTVVNDLIIIYPENEGNNTVIPLGNADHKEHSTLPPTISPENSIEADVDSMPDPQYKVSSDSKPTINDGQVVLKMKPDLYNKPKPEKEVEIERDSNLNLSHESNPKLEQKPKLEEGEEIDEIPSLKSDPGIHLNDLESTLESEQEQDYKSDLDQLFPTIFKQFRYGEYRDAKGKLKTRPIPTYPGFYKTILNRPPQISDNDDSASGTPAPSTSKPTSQTPKPVIFTSGTIPTTTIITTPRTLYNLSTTTIAPDMKILCKKENAYYAIPYECDTFIECKQHDVRKYMCPDGLIFNATAQWPEYPCAHPSKVRCANEKIVHEPEPIGDCPRRFGSFPVLGGDCGQYVVCDEGRAVHMKCPTGLAFNSVTTGCDWPENVPNCKPKVFDNFTCPTPPMDLYGRISEKVYNYKYRNSCEEYIACSNGEPRLLRCDPGKSFDEISEHCIDSTAVRHCKNKSN